MVVNGFARSFKIVIFLAVDLPTFENVIADLMLVFDIVFLLNVRHKIFLGFVFYVFVELMNVAQNIPHSYVSHLLSNNCVQMWNVIRRSSRLKLEFNRYTFTSQLLISKFRL